MFLCSEASVVPSLQQCTHYIQRNNPGHYITKDRLPAEDQREWFEQAYASDRIDTVINIQQGSFILESSNKPRNTLKAIRRDREGQ